MTCKAGMLPTVSPAVLVACLLLAFCCAVCPQVALFSPESIPFDQLAFSSVSITLRLYLEDLRTGTFRAHHGGHCGAPGLGGRGRDGQEVGAALSET